MAIEARSHGNRLRPRYLAAWLALILVIVVAAFVRLGPREDEPAITIVTLEGEARVVTLESMKRLPTLSRRGTYQNQYGNWRDEGVYSGVLLVNLIGRSETYESVRVVAGDGYEIVIERERVEDSEYPMVLAYAMDGQEVPAWSDGFRTAVLPEDGSVGNEEYGVTSAGTYWVKNVEWIILQ